MCAVTHNPCMCCVTEVPSELFPGQQAKVQSQLGTDGKQRVEAALLNTIIIQA